MKKLLFAVVVILLPFVLLSNPQSLDSLKNELHHLHAKKDKERILSEIAREYLDLNSDSCIYYANSLLKLSRERNDERTTYEALRLLGKAHLDKLEHDKAEQYLYEQLKVGNSLGDSGLIARAYLNIGNFHNNIQKYREAVKWFGKSLEISELLKDTFSMAKALNNSGLAYEDLRDFSKAMQYYEKTYELVKTLNNPYAEAVTLGNMGSCYRELNDYENSIIVLKQALDIFEKLNSKIDLVIFRNNLAASYYMQGQAYLAIQNARAALDVNLKNKLNRKNSMVSSYWIMSLAFAETGQRDSAFYYRHRHEQLRDALFKEEINENLARHKVQFETELKEEQIRRLKAEAEAKEKLLIVLISGIIIATICLFFVVLLYRQKNEASKALLRNNMELVRLSKEREKKMEEIKRNDEGDEVITMLRKEPAHTLSDYQIQQLEKKIRQQLEIEKVFLSGDISLEAMAKELDSNTTYVSKVVNHAWGMNFNGVINHYRIDEARKILSDPKKEDLSINEVAELVGFNSAPVFIRVFKKTTGLTPYHFKKSALELK